MSGTIRSVLTLLSSSKGSTLALLAVAVAIAIGIPSMTTACAGARGTVQTPVELQIAKIADLQDAGVHNTAAERSDSRCSVKLVAARIEKSAPGCYLDQHISDGPGVLHYPCEGDGPAEADFGEHRYTGSMSRGEVLLELLTELDWQDGCHWGTVAAISGNVTTGGKPTFRRLTWNYLDRVLTGEQCSGVCTAHASFAVTSMKDTTTLTPEPPDDWGDEDRD